MALICPNGHRNDEGNRFCDQCGAPLSAAPPSAVGEGPPAAAAVSSSACPVCGQENVPGTAFCDNCGAALPPPQPVADDVSNTTGGGAEGAAVSGGGNGVTVTCARCGVTNDAANRFCDNCGAELGAAQSPGGGAAAALPTDEALTADGEAASAATLPTSTPLPTEGTTMPTTPEAPAQGAPARPDEMAMTGIDTSTPAAGAAAGPSDERARLEETIATQRKLVEQLEQMEASFGAATPAAIRQGLEEARTRLAEAEAQLEALPAPRPEPDPAEVARLEETIATQRKLVEQLEQMEASFGAATPAAIRQGLEEARTRLAEAETELNQLRGGTARPAQQRDGSVASQAAVMPARQNEDGAVSAPAASEPEPQAATSAATPAPVSSQGGAMPTAAVSGGPLPAPAAVAPDRAADQQPARPADQPQPSGPYLRTRDGKAIALPRTGGEVVVGREDPVSGIHPEVDLTPYGGEAGGVSRRHALLREQHGQWTITDLDSTNYTRINGNRLAPQTPTPLEDGARVQFGRVEFEFHQH